MFDLSGKTAVVTGGNSGIGLAMARGLVKAGGNVAIWGRNQEKNRSAVEELNGLRHGAAAAFACDIADEDQIAAAMAGTLEHFGQVDSCFANAGFGGGEIRLNEMTPREWRKMMAINSEGVALTYAHVTSHMIERGEGGKLLVSSSLQSIMGVNRSAHYAAAKASVNGLTRGAAFEMARHQITANAFLFGYFETDMTAAANPKFVEGMIRRIPLRRAGRMSELEGLAVFFASPYSDYITGQCLPVGGGLSIS